MLDEVRAKMRKARKDFPLLLKRNVVYLDSTATTHKPSVVLEKERIFYETKNANPFRGVYALSEECTASYESARERVAAFIGASSADEIVFTRNATESLNLVAYSYGLNFLKEGDEIAVGIAEHHSNFLPWKSVADKTGARLVKIEITKDGKITEEQINNALSERTKVVAITHLSNVLGELYDIKNIARKAHEKGAIIVVDGAQSVAHLAVDVQELDVDFFAFSGHKIYAPTGIGVLYGKKNLLSKMPPFLFGGEMIESVHWDRVKYAEAPHKFEAGTVNTGGAVALHAALDYVNTIGFHAIGEWEEHLTTLAAEGMRKIPNVTIVGSDRGEDHHGIISFVVKDVHPHDAASIFDSESVCVRAGHHCAQPLMDFLGLSSTTRASFAFYNTEEDVERFLSVLKSIRRKMGYDE